MSKKLSNHDVRKRLIAGVERHDISRADLEAVKAKKADQETKQKVAEVVTGHSEASGFKLKGKQIEKVLVKLGDEPDAQVRPSPQEKPQQPPSLGFDVHEPVPGSLSLFPGGEQAPDYDAKMQALIADLEAGKTGQVLDFGPGRAFKVERLLGHGNTTLALSVSPNDKDSKLPAEAVLRVPLRSGTMGLRGTGRKVADLVNDIPRAIEAGMGDLVPKVYDHVDNQFTLVEHLKPAFDLKELLLQQLDGKDTAAADAKLKGFAEAFAPYSTVGDFEPHNIVFDEASQTWKLFDPTEVRLFEGEFYPQDLERKLFTDADALEYRPLEKLIRQFGREPGTALFATQDTRERMRTEPRYTDAQLQHADETLRKLDRYLYEARLKLLSGTDGDGKLTGKNPVSGATLTLQPTTMGGEKKIAADLKALGEG